MRKQAADLIDIVIPVYRDADLTRECLQSVLRSQDASLGLLHIINDASPEPEVAEFLESFARHDGVNLIVHSENYGFVSSVNAGLEASAGRDVVILNSDAQVPRGWLERLKAAAVAHPKAASITPISNNATICSYPNFGVENPLVDGMNLQAVDELISKSNPGVTVEIPTGVGFCMFMRRAAIDEVGQFDVEAFGRGYGEENDWCLRASAKGWHHLMCADLFVYHAGGVSFGDDFAAQQKKALKVLSARYPNYERIIADFIELDPAEPVRHSIDLDRARHGSSDQVLSEYRRRLLGERDARYKLDKDRHQQVQALDELLQDARQHVVEEAQRYEQILANVRAEAAQTDSKYAAQIEQMAQGYAELEAQTREAEAQIRSLSEALDSLNRNWLVRLYRWLLMRRNKI